MLAAKVASLLAAVFMFALCSTACAADAWPADDWPQFRGPTGDGISLATNLPLTWSPTQNVKWKMPVPGRGRSSPFGRELYLLSDDGFVSCVDALSGETLGRVRAGGNYAASPVHAFGRIYCFSREGKTVVLQANRDLTLLAENQLDGPVFASPAFVDSAIYLRTDSHLYCLSAEPALRPD
jgi:outer membrane protein assembly factor BamB